MGDKKLKPSWDNTVSNCLKRSFNKQDSEMTAKQIFAMISAGAACALLVLAAANVGPGGVPLLMLGAFPIYVASLSFGTAVGAGASIIAMLIAGFAGSAQSAMVIGLAFSVPASIIGHQANLAQTHEDGSVEWYPISQLFFNLCLAIIGGIIALGFVINYDTAALSEQMNVAVSEVFRQNPSATPVTDEDIAALTESMFRIMPFLFSGIWLVTHITNLYFAAYVSRASGLMPRPKDDIPATINLPKPAVIILLASIVCASFMSGPVQIVAAVIAGVFIMAFAMLGLANLHLKARNNPGGMIMMLIAYALIIILFIPLYIFAVTGILRNLSGTNPNQPSSD